METRYNCLKDIQNFLSLFAERLNSYTISFRRFNIFHFLYVKRQFVPISNSLYAQSPASFCIFLKNRTMKRKRKLWGLTISRLFVTILDKDRNGSAKRYQVTGYVFERSIKIQEIRINWSFLTQRQNECACSAVLLKWPFFWSTQAQLLPPTQRKCNRCNNIYTWHIS